MKSLLLPLLVLAVSALAVPDYEPPFRISADGDPIELSIGHANPLIVDWNEDGLKDLILGQFSGGKLRYYQNDDSNDSPMFGSYTYLQADGTDISLSAG